jgi:hypothetical protein
MKGTTHTHCFTRACNTRCCMFNPQQIAVTGEHTEAETRARRDTRCRAGRRQETLSGARGRGGGGEAERGGRGEGGKKGAGGDLKSITPRRDERRIPPPRLIAVTYTGDIQANAFWVERWGRRSRLMWGVGWWAQDTRPERVRLCA